MSQLSNTITNFINCCDADIAWYAIKIFLVYKIEPNLKNLRFEWK